MNECEIAGISRGVYSVVNFCVHGGMVIPTSSVVGGVTTRGRQQSGPSTSDFGREPLFLHYDPDEGGLITADQIEPDKMAGAGAHALESGIATSIFSAMFPATGKGKAGGDNDKKKTTSPKPGAAVTPVAGPAAVPLQRAKQSQSLSLSLPTGLGKTSFACFAKDKRRTLFGQFVDVFAQLAASPMLSYLPMLSLPAVGVSTVNAVRSQVANLQAHGQNQQWIIVVIPNEHSDAMKAAQMDKMKLMDGFLAPNTAKALDVYDAYPGAAPGVSCITISVGVQPAKKSGAVGK